MPLAALALFLIQNAPATGASPANGATGGAAPVQQGWTDMIPLGLALIGIIYFVVIRPASRDRKRQATMMSALKKGDRVLLSSGLVATIAAIKDREVLVTVDDKNPLRMRFQKQAIQSILNSDDDTPAEAGAAESK